MSEENRPNDDTAEAQTDAGSGDAQPAMDNTDPGNVAGRIEELPAADGAAVMQGLSRNFSAEVAEYLDPETAGQILAEMDPTEAAAVIADMEAPEASMVLAAMDPDDRVDILGHVPAPLHDQLVAEMNAKDAAEVRDLERYPRDTAGGIMTTEVTSLPEDLTVEEAITELRRLNETLEQMFYVYVVDKRGHLVGVLSMRDLILAKPERQISQIMRSNVRSVPATMDQEEVARLFRKYNYLAMPVVDARNRLAGLITIDDVVDVIQDEATEDVQKMFGAGAEERLASPWHFSFKKRIWWLEVNLATAFLAAWVISRYDEVISKLAILAAYQSIVTGMGGNAGAQALAVAIRGIALGESGPKLLWRVLKKEMIIGLLTGVVVGATTWACAALGVFGHDKYNRHAVLVGGIVCAALILNHINASVTGVLIPFIMKRLGFDPAQSATIFATTFTDCGGFFLTLWLAQHFMPRLLS
jgi:magnesium transporter